MKKNKFIWFIILGTGVATSRIGRDPQRPELLIDSSDKTYYLPSAYSKNKS